MSGPWRSPIRSGARRESTANCSSVGFDVSQRTVARLMPRRSKPSSQTWRTFLENHIADLVSIDFFLVPTATFDVLYVFVVLLHRHRQVVHFNVTDSPTAAWTAQQIIEAFPRYLLRRLRSYLRYYHGSRTHLALEKDAPEPRAIELPERGRVVALPVSADSTIATSAARRSRSR